MGRQRDSPTGALPTIESASTAGSAKESSRNLPTTEEKRGSKPSREASTWGELLPPQLREVQPDPRLWPPGDLPLQVPVHWGKPGRLTRFHFRRWSQLER